MRRSEAGFSLIEILIAAALFVVVSFGALETVRQLGLTSQHLASRHLAYEGLERLTAQLRTEARSATSIAVVSSTSGTNACQQVDFFTADSVGPHFWSYANFPNHAASDPIPGDAVARFAGSSPLRSCDPTQAASIVATHVRIFAPQWVKASTLSTHTDPYNGTLDSPFVGGSVTDGLVSLGVASASGQPLQGGNAFVELQIANDDAARVVDLVPGVFPTGYLLKLAYTCDDRCTVGHDTNAPKTITSCALTSWQLYDSKIAYIGNWTPSSSSPPTDVGTTYYWVEGYFDFHYSGPTGDTIDHVVLATNYGQPWPDGTHGTPIDHVQPSTTGPSAALSQWFSSFQQYVDDAGPYSGPMMGASTMQQELSRCANVNADGQNGSFSYD